MSDELVTMFWQSMVLGAGAAVVVAALVVGVCWVWALRGERRGRRGH